MLSYIYVPVPKAYYSLSPAAKLTWTGLCSFAAWKDGRFYKCFPGNAALVERTGLSRSTIKRALHELMEAGFIIRRLRLRGKVHLSAECLPGPVFGKPEEGPKRPPVGSEEDGDASMKNRTSVCSEPRTLPEHDQEHDQGKEEEEAAALSRILVLWNRILTPLGFPRMAACTSGRCKALKARMRESAERRNMAWWEGLFNQIAGTPFLVQSVKEGARWFTLDWLLREENLVKLLEGRYEGQNHPHIFRPVRNLDVESFVTQMMRDPFWGGGEDDDGEGTPAPLGLP